MSGHPSPTVRVACGDSILLDEVIRYLEEFPHWRLLASAHSAQELLSGVASQADFTILSDALVVELAADARAQSLSTELIVLGRKETSRTLRAALKAGARDFVLWPDDRLRLRDLIEERTVAIATLDRPSLGALHAVWAPKGGSGTSVVASHLAAALATFVKSPILMDLDLAHSDQTAILGAEDEKKSVLDLLRVANELSPSMVDSVAWTQPEGFRAILAPGSGGEAGSVEAADVARVIATVREAAEHVIADLPSGLSDVSTTVLQEASTVLLVVTPDLLSLRRARDAFKGLRAAGVDPTRFVGVLNQAGGADVSEKDVRSVLGLTRTFRVRADMQVYRAANRGELSLAGKRMLAPVARMLCETVPFKETPLIEVRPSRVQGAGKSPAPNPVPPNGGRLPPPPRKGLSTPGTANTPTVVRVVGSASKWRS